MHELAQRHPHQNAQCTIVAALQDTATSDFTLDNVATARFDDTPNGYNEATIGGQAKEATSTAKSAPRKTSRASSHHVNPGPSYAIRQTLNSCDPCMVFVAEA